MTKIMRRTAVIAALLIAAAPSMAAAMTARQVIDTAVDRYLESIRGIDDYTIVTKEFNIYNLKTEVDGEVVFKSKTEMKGVPEPTAALSAQTVNYYNIFDPETLDYLRENASYEGTSRIDGHPVHVLSVPEIDLEEGDEEVKAENLRMYIDSEKWVIRKQVFDAEFEAGGRKRNISPEIILGDYRNIEGLLIPFKTVMKVPGLFDSVSEEEMEQARRGMEEFEKQLEQLPESQREMIEAQVRPQLERLREILESGTFTLEVEEVKVNTGLTEDLFE